MPKLGARAAAERDRTRRSPLPLAGRGDRGARPEIDCHGPLRHLFQRPRVRARRCRCSSAASRPRFSSASPASRSASPAGSRWRWLRLYAPQAAAPGGRRLYRRLPRRSRSWSCSSSSTTRCPSSASGCRSFAAATTAHLPRRVRLCGGDLQGRHRGGAARPVRGGAGARPQAAARDAKVVLPQAIRIVVPPITAIASTSSRTRRWPRSSPCRICSSRQRRPRPSPRTRRR